MPPDRVQRISTAGPWETEGGYARAVRVDERVIVAGTTASRPGKEVPADVGEQTRIAFETIKAALAHTGAEMSDIVRTRMYVVDIATNGPAVLRVHGELMRDVRPAAAMIGVSGLIEPELFVEIEAEAVIGSGAVGEF